MNWINISHDLPINDLDEFDGNVLGVVSRIGNLSVEFVHFDGDAWYDKESKSCKVTHWMPISLNYLTEKKT